MGLLEKISEAHPSPHSVPAPCTEVASLTRMQWYLDRKESLSWEPPTPAPPVLDVRLGKVTLPSGPSVVSAVQGFSDSCRASGG